MFKYNMNSVIHDREFKEAADLDISIRSTGEWGADPTEKTINAVAVLPIDLQP